MSLTITITSVVFRDFKALRNYSIKLQRMNILVGANNSGKSTILGAFRALSTGIQLALAKKADNVAGPEGHTFGYKLSEKSLPISLENVHTDYSARVSRKSL